MSEFPMDISSTEFNRMLNEIDQLKKDKAKLCDALEEAINEMSLWGDDSRRCDSLVREHRALTAKMRGEG